MLSKKMQEALNAQINAESWSSYLYLSMSADMASKGMNGFANWMFVQFKEEQDHAQKIFNYILDRNCKPEVRPIGKVESSWKSPLDIFKEALKHEQVVTEMINNLYAIAVEEKDYATLSMLKWFVDEQVEEEKSVQNIIDHLVMINDNTMGLYSLNKELGGRAYELLAI